MSITNRDTVYSFPGPCTVRNATITTQGMWTAIRGPLEQLTGLFRTDKKIIQSLPLLQGHREWAISAVCKWALFSMISISTFCVRGHPFPFLFYQEKLYLCQCFLWIIFSIPQAKYFSWSSHFAGLLVSWFSLRQDLTHHRLPSNSSCS